MDFRPRPNCPSARLPIATPGLTVPDALAKTTKKKAAVGVYHLRLGMLRGRRHHGWDWRPALSLTRAEPFGLTALARVCKRCSGNTTKGPKHEPTKTGD